MNKLENMRTFVAVAKHRSFVAASRELDLSAPAVTRSVAQLESFLGAKLFTRTTRTVTLTDVGSAYLREVYQILEDIEQAEAAASGNHRDPQGTLSLTAPVLFGQRYVVPVVMEYLAQHPLVDVQVTLDDSVGNILEDGFDIAVRIGELQESSLYAIKVGEVRRLVCAAPAYIKAHGVPEKPDDLVEHAVVQATPAQPSSLWTFQSNGERHSVRVTPRLQCNQNAAAIHAALLGCGLTRVMSYQVAREIEEGQLVRVLEDFEGEPLPIHVMHLEGRRADAKSRAFIDLAVEKIRAQQLA